MEPFGQRIGTIRKERGLSQSALALAAGFDQPRLSRIENGTLPASVEIIGKVAGALRRSARELVAGTDREGYYVAQALSPEEIAKEQRDAVLESIMGIRILRAVYERVVALFQAVYGGPFIAVDLRVEQLYVGLRARCERVIAASPVELPDLFFPDHLDPIEEDDALGWEYTERDLRQSLNALLRIEHEVDRSELSDDEFEALLTEHMHIEVVDEQIAQIREHVRDANQKWNEKVERAAKLYHDRFDNSTKTADTEGS